MTARCIRLRGLALPAAVLAHGTALAVESAATPTLPPSTDDRIVLSADGSTLTGTNGGAGGSAGWLHNFDADTIVGVAAEAQSLANSNWTFGTLSGSKTLGSGDARYSVYGEAREGVVHERGGYLYSSEALGVIGSFDRRLSVTLEDKQFNILKTHGNLPKIGVGYQWTPHVATSASYAYTVGGNLGTKITVLRVDYTGPTVNYLAGVAFGDASPAVLASGPIGSVIAGSLVSPGSTLREGFVGASMPFPSLRSDLSVVLDYIDLSKSSVSETGIGGDLVFFPAYDSKHFTLTLSYIFHFGKGVAR